MKVRELMNTNVMTCRRGDCMDVPARLMWEEDIGFVPVVDADGRIEGVVTDRDLCMSAYTTGAPLSGLLVETAMAKKIHSCHVDDSVEDAERTMKNAAVRRLPVIDADGRIVGVVALNDLFRAATGRKPKLEQSELMDTMAAICTPRAHAAAQAQAA